MSNRMAITYLSVVFSTVVFIPSIASVIDRFFLKLNCLWDVYAVFWSVAWSLFTISFSRHLPITDSKQIGR